MFKKKLRNNWLRYVPSVLTKITRSNQEMIKKKNLVYFTVKVVVQHNVACFHSRKIV